MSPPSRLFFFLFKFYLFFMIQLLLESHNSLLRYHQPVWWPPSFPKVDRWPGDAPVIVQIATTGGNNRSRWYICSSGRATAVQLTILMLINGCGCICRIVAVVESWIRAWCCSHALLLMRYCRTIILVHINIMTIICRV